MRRTYVILGMHRSGTSFLSRCLQLGGVDIGHTLIRGHYENADFVHLNDKILQLAGGSWDNPPDEGKIKIVEDKLSNEIINVINKNKKDMWGWKDPRTSLTIRGYLPHLSEDVYIIAIFRNPSLVAESLRRRNGFSIEKGVKLAKEHNARIIKVLKERFT